MAKQRTSKYTLNGRITDKNDAPIAGLIVRAYHQDRTNLEYLLGEGTRTDEEGNYGIEFSSQDFIIGESGGPDVFIRVLKAERVLGESEVKRGAKKKSKLNLKVDHTREDPNEPWLRVYGIVRNQYGELLDGLTVQAFDRDLRNQEYLGGDVTKAGKYEIRYKRSYFRKAEKENADLVVQVLDDAGQELAKTPIQYNVPDEVEVNIVLDGAQYQGPSSWEVLDGTLTPLLEGVSPLEMREDDQFQDISFLTGESGQNQLAVGTWVIAYRLAAKLASDKTPLEPAVFYGFICQGQPALLPDSFLDALQHPERMVLLEEKTLRDLCNLLPQLQQNLLEKALTNNLIPARIRPNEKEILAALQQIKLGLAADQTFGAGKGTIGQLLELVPEAKRQQTAFMAAFTAYKGPLNDFWTELEKNKVLRPETVLQVKRAFQLSGLTRNYIPLVGELSTLFQRGDVRATREFATYDHDQWKQIFQRPGPDGKPIGVPANMDGDEPTKMEQYATILDRLFERAYPTTSFAAKLGRTEASPVQAKDDIVHFIQSNPGFQLDRHRIDQYLAENPDALTGIKNKQQFVPQLKIVQRIFKLNPTHKVVDALLQRNITSAQDIYFMGKGQLITTLAGSEIKTLDAKKLYYKAENAYALALTLFGNFNNSVTGVVPHAVPSPAPTPAAQAKIETLPNLQTLFGSLDYCECSECRSVYSLASYFVDILHFLGARNTQGTGINASKNVAQVLLERRPDLGEIELSCENTNTPLPYIDLVNEILEDVVVPPTPVTLNSTIETDLTDGVIKNTVFNELTAKNIPIANDAQVYAPDVRGQYAIRDAEHSYKVFKTGATLRLLPTKQTHLSAAELRANPEYTNPDAYNFLAQQVFPLNLPFDLWYLQTRAYLNHLGVAQPRLFKLFQQSGAGGTLAPTDLQMACAVLGITEVERQILTGTLAGKQSWDFWGLAQSGNNIPDPENPADPTANITGTWLNVLSSVNVMLHRSGLQYKELLQLLDMKYVNPDSSIFIFDTADPNAANCDTSQFTIRNLTEDGLNRIHRFIRLWRKLGCAMWELDILLPDTSTTPGTINKQITDAVLQDIAGMKRLHDKFNLDWRITYSLYNSIDHNLYHDESADGAPLIQTLYQRLFRNKLVDAVAQFPASPDLLSGPIASQIPGILAAFRIKELDLNLIFDDLRHAATNPWDSATDPLSAAVLSRIYRHTVLAKALNLSIDQYLRIKRLWAQDPFASPADTLLFVKLAHKVAASGFSIFEIDYLLAHNFKASSGVALDDKTVTTLLKTLRDGLQKINDDLLLKTEETAEAYVRSKLGLLTELAKDADQTAALAIIDDTWQGAAADRNPLIDKYFVSILVLTTAHTQLAPIPGALTPAAHQTQVDARFAYVQAALQTFLMRTQREAFVQQATADTLQLGVPSAAKLTSQLNLSGSTQTLLQNINDPQIIAKNPDGSYVATLDETTFPNIFQSMRLLHKDALMITRLEMSPTELDWWLSGTHAADMSWVHPKDFPLTSNPAISVPIAKWQAIQEFFAWKKNLPLANLTAFNFLDKVLDGTVTAAANVTTLAQLTAWQEQDITDLTSAFQWDNKQEFKKSANLLRLTKCIAALRRLGVNAARALDWTIAVPTQATAESLKQTVKAKYDLTQWEQVIQPLQDSFREFKCDALVNWLITHPNQASGQSWKDADGLYNYYLIDVQMSSCMLTSRLVQAAGSVQLFVQRCLLNLEKDILAKTDLDPKWKQWKWMEYYRVWEANRQVFLYPENWIEPELRDEKSPFFKDLENDLTKNDVNSDTAEEAYRNYLEKLDQVANLEIRAMFNQAISPDESVLHVIGRTRSSQSPQYFYRTRINGGRWLAWDKINVEINANQLVAGIHNRRLYLFWPQFLDKAPQPTEGSVPTEGASGFTIAQPDKYWEVRLFWSELKKGKWTSKISSDSFAKVEQNRLNGRIDTVQFRVRLLPAIIVKLFTPLEIDTELPMSAQGFEKLGNQVDHVIRGLGYGDWDNAYKDNFELLPAPSNSHFSNGLIVQEDANLYFNYNTSWDAQSVSLNTPLSTNAQTVLLLTNANVGSLVVLDSQARGLVTGGTFSLWDSHRTYMVDYSINTDTYYVQQTRYSRTTSNFQFFIHYHPFIELFIKELNIWGLKGLLNRRIQIAPTTVPDSPPIFDFKDYKPTADVIPVYKLPNGTVSYPVEDVDFSYTGAYSPYNWELFFHAPMYIANKLATNQRFEEALEWYNYIFDPTNTDTALTNPDTPQQKYWLTKPFYETTKADYYKQKIENIMLAIAKGDAEVREQVKEWRDNPFNPHLIARMRTVAYQKNVLIKYIRMLIAWGDQAFRRDSLESLNEATQLYTLASAILGPRPKSIPKKVANPIKTFYQLEQEGIDDFGNALEEIENLLPSVPSSSSMGDDKPELPRLDVLYFCIPNNENLLTLWDTVADRLFKIRHCMNIEGIVHQPPLFEPAIDPAMLVAATAAGLDIGGVLNDMSAPMPLYRFTFMIQRALELVTEVKNLGSALLTALEKKDAEGLAQLRSSNELILLDKVRLVKAKQVDETLSAWEAVQESRKVTEQRQTYYSQLIQGGLNPLEIISLALTGVAIGLQVGAIGLNAGAAGTSLIPEFSIGVAGFGGSPNVTIGFGGGNITGALSKSAEVLSGISNTLQMGASMTSTVGNYMRRAAEWDFQKTLAEKELPQIDKQIAAADLRHQIADQELQNHDTQKDNAQKEDDYLHSKFTNQDLYDWMTNQLATVYFQSYQLAYDIAKRAERCFRYELGLSSSDYIQFGYWDSLNKGLLSGEKLFYDLKRLEATYYEQNRREYELTKHISLAQLDPVALLKLRQNGSCIVDVPETVFDMDYPGHYFRRLKSVALSIPCVAGPYTTIACTLTLASNRLRKDATLLGGNYERDTTIDDPRFRDEIAAIQSIATSNAQTDDGLFELNFRDERYLPFEGAGALSTWQIELNEAFRQFDYATISDVIIHLNYTAREGGDLLKSKAVEAFNTKLNALALAETKSGLYRVFDLKRETPDKFYKFLHPANPADDQEIVLDKIQDRLPYFARAYTTLKARKIEVVAKMKDANNYRVMLSPLGTADADLLLLGADTTYSGMDRAFTDLTGSEVPLGDWTLKLKLDGATDFKSLAADAVHELFLIINYTVA